jgi:hypothetical protein
MLDSRALVAAGGAPCTLPQLVARYVSAPANDRHGAGNRSMMRTLLAIDPHPRRGTVQVAECCAGAQNHGRHWMPADAAQSSRSVMADNARELLNHPAPQCDQRIIEGPSPN